MNATADCPDGHVLQQFGLGQLPPEDVERLASHVEQCQYCISTMHDLNVEDTLVAAMQTPVKDSGAGVPQCVEALIDRLCRSDCVTGDVGDPASERMTDLHPTEESFSPPSGTLSNGELQQILAPPQQPDEIGRLGPYRVLRVLGTGGMGHLREPRC